MSRSTSPLPTLPYEAAALTRERLEDGTLRLTIVSHRGHFMRESLLGFLVLAAFVAACYFIVPPRLQLRLLLMGGIGLGIGLLFNLIMLTQPRSYTSVFEAGTFGIRVQTVVAGDPVRKTFARSEIQAIRADGPLIIDSRGNEHPYLPFETKQRIREVADALREAIG